MPLQDATSKKLTTGNNSCFSAIGNITYILRRNYIIKRSRDFSHFIDKHVKKLLTKY